LFFGEPGAARVSQAIRDDAVISSVSMVEVVTRLIDRGLIPDAARQQFDDLALEVIPLNTDLAYRAACLRPSTKSAGLSLADRCCLALAEQRGMPTFTADRAWSTLQVPISIEVIR